MAKKARGFSVYWGEKHEKLFEDCLIRSLSWPLNKAAMQANVAVLDIYVKESGFAAAAEIAKCIGVGIMLHAIPESLHADEPMMGAHMLNFYRDHLKRCFDNGQASLMLPVDTMFGGGSIESIFKVGAHKDSVVFVAHARVNPEIMHGLEAINSANRFGPESSIGNAKLVSAAWKNLHRSWAEAESGHDRANSFVGGVSWSRLSDDVVSVIHKLPTPYLINVTKADVDFFNQAIVFGSIDHDYPTYCVINQGRARVVGSSDAAFIVEITDANKNVPPLDFIDRNDPTKFWKNNPHNVFFGQVSVIFRSE